MSSPVRSLREVVPREDPIEIVAIGASAGGVEALTAVVRQLPVELPAAVLVVLHVAETGTSVLAAILDRCGPLPASVARDGDTIVAGHVYVAPPAHHLTVDGATVRLLRGPRENGHRPAVDPLFRSVGAAYGPNAAGVVLSGALDDGTAGLRDLKRAGGMAIVQDPEGALYASMPRNAMTQVDVDAILPLHQIGFAIARLVGHAGALAAPRSTGGLPPAYPADIASSAISSRFSCPDCGGVLYEFCDGTFDRFACSVGHAYSFESLFEEQSQETEQALWRAVRSLEDRVVLLRRMEQHSRNTGVPHAARAFEQRAREVSERAREIREALQRVAGPWQVDDADDRVSSDRQAT